MPATSGARVERVEYVRGRTSRESLSAKTVPDKLDMGPGDKCGLSVMKGRDGVRAGNDAAAVSKCRWFREGDSTSRFMAVSGRASRESIPRNLNILEALTCLPGLSILHSRYRIF